MSTLTLNYQGPTDRSWQPSAGHLSAIFKVWFQRARQRQQLAQLTDRELRDIGVSLAEAYSEATKPFWQS